MRGRDKISRSLLSYVDIGVDHAARIATMFTKSRDRLLTTEMSRRIHS